MPASTSTQQLHYRSLIFTLHQDHSSTSGRLGWLHQVCGCLNGLLARCLRKASKCEDSFGTILRGMTVGVRWYDNTEPISQAGTVCALSRATVATVRKADRRTNVEETKVRPDPTRSLEEKKSHWLISDSLLSCVQVCTSTCEANNTPLVIGFEDQQEFTIRPIQPR